MAREAFIKWFEEAKNDFEAGIILKQSQKFNLAVFHFQQSAEKPIKALHYFYGLQPWGHSVLKLVQELIDLEKYEYEQFLSIARQVDRHYTTTRYPDTLPALSPKEAYDNEIAETVQDNVKRILDFINENVIQQEDMYDGEK